jgi:hypothetical protein
MRRLDQTHLQVRQLKRVVSEIPITYAHEIVTTQLSSFDTCSGPAGSSLGGQVVRPDPLHGGSRY